MSNNGARVNFRDDGNVSSHHLNRPHNNNNVTKDVIKQNDLDKIQPAPIHVRPTELTLLDTKELGLSRNGDIKEPGSVYDYSFMSSCSLPSDRASVSTPSPSLPHVNNKVTLRNSKNVTNNASESGRLLNSALARHFRKLQCQHNVSPHERQSSAGADPSTRLLSDNLYQYLVDVFSQLDSNHSGFVTRQDFECLCEILELDPSPPPSSETPVSGLSSGLQWLSSYHPRPGTPASPIR